MLPEIDQSELEGTTGEAPAADQANPETGALDLNKFREELLGAVNESFDTRFQGFQKTLAKRDQKITELERLVQEANRSDLTEEQRTALDVQEKDAQIVRLQMELELKELEREFPQIAPVYRRVLEADSPRSQMEILNELIAAQEAADKAGEKQPEENNAQNLSSVDPNSPAETGTGGMSYEDAFEKDPSLLERILKGAPRLRSPE